MGGVAEILLSKVLEAAVTLLGLVLLTFVLLKALPGGPFDDEISLHPQVREAFVKSWALDKPTHVQIVAYVGSVLRGDFGVSLQDPGLSVAEVLRRGLSRTLGLNFIALAVIFVLGFSAALLGSARPGSRWESGVKNITLALVSLPSLFLGPFLIYVFSLWLGLLPVALLESPLHYILPVVTLSLRPAAYLARILMNALREARGADYMRTAKAKGLSAAQALRRHALRNSLMPVLGYSAPLVVGLLSGSFMVEVLFAVPGLGTAFVESLGTRDYPVILGLTIFYGVLLVTSSMIFEALQRIADPRLREAR